MNPDFSLLESSPAEISNARPRVPGAGMHEQARVTEAVAGFKNNDGKRGTSHSTDDCDVDPIDAAGEFTPKLAIVVFSDRASLRWLHLLKPGFRHCFVLLRTADQWLYYDPMAHYTFASAVGAYPLMALLRFFRKAGYRVLMVRPRLPPPPPPRPLAWRPYTCVEAVKRVLGLRAPWILTPWQLFQLLVRIRWDERATRRARLAHDGRTPKEPVGI